MATHKNLPFARNMIWLPRHLDGNVTVMYSCGDDAITEAVTFVHMLLRVLVYTAQ